MAARVHPPLRIHGICPFLCNHLSNNPPSDIVSFFHWSVLWSAAVSFCERAGCLSKLGSPSGEKKWFVSMRPYCVCCPRSERRSSPVCQNFLSYHPATFGTCHRTILTSTCQGHPWDLLCGVLHVTYIVSFRRAICLWHSFGPSWPYRIRYFKFFGPLKINWDYVLLRLHFNL